MSSSIHTPLISLSTPFLNTPLYYLFTPHSITKISHPNPIDTPRLSTPLGFVPPNPQTHPPHFIPKQTPKSGEPTILRTQRTSDPPHRNQRASQIRRSSKFGLITQLFSWFFWFFCSRNICSRIRNMNLSVRISLNPVTYKHFGFPMSGFMVVSGFEGCPEFIEEF